MGSAKTANLLLLKHDVENKPGSGYKVVLVAPVLDERHGKGVVKSRAGLEAKADILLGPTDDIKDKLPTFKPFDLVLVLVDEAQFLSTKNVESLRSLADNAEFDVKIIAYGLRTDYQTRLFEGSKRLLELVDDIQPIHTICSFCEQTALHNMRVGDFGKEQIVLGGSDMYKETCSSCYMAETGGY